MKKKNVISVLLIVVFIFCVVLIKRNNYKIVESPKKYILKTEAQQKNYTAFIKNYIKPDKLGNFLNTQTIHFSFIEEYNSGTEAIEWFKYEAYKELFYQMFDKYRKGYEDCPVTENFKNKFGNNLFEHFEFNNVEDSDIGCILLDEEKTLEITETGDYTVGEPGYIYYHHFHYVLDDEGSVDDVIFDYTE